jgi:hypothetical protein
VYARTGIDSRPISGSVRCVSIRIRRLLVATALTLTVAATLAMLGAGPHAVATSDGSEHAVTQRRASGVAKTTLRVPVAAAAALGGPHAAADVAPIRAAVRAESGHAADRPYARLRVYRL